MEDSQGRTYDYICFSDLVDELDFSDRTKVEESIKKRLKQFNLGDYNQDQADYIRQLKTELISEVRLKGKSKYFHKSKSRHEELEDFEIERMILDYNKNLTG